MGYFMLIMSGSTERILWHDGLYSWSVVIQGEFLHIEYLLDISHAWEVNMSQRSEVLQLFSSREAKRWGRNGSSLYSAQLLGPMEMWDFCGQRKTGSMWGRVQREVNTTHFQVVFQDTGTSTSRKVLVTWGDNHSHPAQHYQSLKFSSQTAHVLTL